MSTRIKLLRAFEGRGGRVMSGAVLARRLGVSRTSIWKHVQALQQAGFPLVSAARSGYRYEGPDDFSLFSVKLPPSLRSWVHVHHEVIAESTQALAKRAAEAGAAEGHLWAAERQTGGRGRLGRQWTSGLGGLWFSLLLRPALPPSQIPALGLVAATALARSVQGSSGLPARLKWPNDLVIGEPGRRRKAAGILIEMAGESDRTAWVVLGIGLNVHNALPAELDGIGIALAQAGGRRATLAAHLIGFLKEFRGRYLVYQEQGFGPFQREYWELYGEPDRPVRLRTAHGTVEGVARGVDPQGALIVESSRQNVHVTEGEIAS